MTKLWRKEEKKRKKAEKEAKKKAEFDARIKAERDAKLKAEAVKFDDYDGMRYKLEMKEWHS